MAESLSRLEIRGHVMKAGALRGRRPTYLLVSPIFAQKQRAGIEEVVSGPNRTLRLSKHKEGLMGSCERCVKKQKSPPRRDPGRPSWMG